MRLVLTIVAVLVMLAGIVWILQGLSVLPGSFMSGQPRWAVNGIIAVVLGGGLLLFANRRRGGVPPRR